MSLSIRNDNETNEAIVRVLKDSIYPTATSDELVMVLNYCKARRIDPILKLIHLVPMSQKTGRKDAKGKDIYEKKNVIMPGVGLYRIDAVRTGQYAGMSEPDFGEDITETIGESKFTYPKWCRITVKKILENGSIAEFTAKEYWKENYATKNNFTTEPNSMWIKRAYGQLAKCTEAQALRKAFPDAIGQEYTKEEMEGKTLEYVREPAKVSLITQDKKIEESDQLLIEKDETEDLDFKSDVERMEKASSKEELENAYKSAYKFWAEKRDKEKLRKIIELKDVRKSEFAEMINEDIKNG